MGGNLVEGERGGKEERREIGIKEREGEKIKKKSD